MIEKTNSGWIGVDLDGTLANYDGWKGVSHVGDPVPLMLARVKAWIGEGREVRIFTARVSPQAIALNRYTLHVTLKPIEDWCVKHLGVVLRITHEKDMDMIELWDDRAIQVVANTGIRSDGKV